MQLSGICLLKVANFEVTSLNAHRINLQLIPLSIKLRNLIIEILFGYSSTICTCIVCCSSYWGNQVLLMFINVMQISHKLEEMEKMQFVLDCNYRLIGRVCHYAEYMLLFCNDIMQAVAACHMNHSFLIHIEQQSALKLFAFCMPHIFIFSFNVSAPRGRRRSRSRSPSRSCLGRLFIEIYHKKLQFHSAASCQSVQQQQQQQQQTKMRCEYVLRLVRAKSDA